MENYNIAILSSHPIQYKAPLFKAISNNSNISLIVYFQNKIGINTSIYDKDLKKDIKWDIPLLEGYDYEFLNNKFSIFKKLLQSRHDCILISSYSKLSSWLAFLAAYLSGTKIIFRGEADPLQKKSAFKSVFKKITITPFLKNIDAILYSFELNKQYYKNFGVPEEKLFFFPCAVDTERFQNTLSDFKKERNKLRQGFGIKENDFVIGFTGKLIKRKRPFDLLKSFRNINKKDLSIEGNIHLLYVGSGKLENNLKSFVEEKNIKNVHFAGFKNQSELPYYYNIMDLFVLPSKKDPSPKVLNEAMSFSLPIITTNKVGTAPDMIVGEGVGVAVEVGNIDQIKDNILKIINNDDLRSDFKNNALKATDKWSFEEDVNGLIEAINFIENKDK